MRALTIAGTLLSAAQFCAVAGWPADTFAQAPAKAAPKGAPTVAAVPASAEANVPSHKLKPNNGCRNTGPAFEPWLAQFKKDAAAKGVSQRTIAAALDGMTLEQSIINIDRGQRFFSQTFISFSDKLASMNRVTNGRKRLEMHKAQFERAEREYGVAPAVIAAFWALESDFGSGMGNKPVLRSLAALAWDCRRGPMFREELLAALKIIDRGDLTPADMIGSWAGELGQTQFLPTHYFNHAVDWDGDGKRNLMKSTADIIGSSAKFLKSIGWRAGEPWLQEVKLPANFPWEQADLAVKQPRSYWAAKGVKLADGSPLPSDNVQTSILLLQSRHGPAFLAHPNFSAFTEWNQSLNYATTAAYLATRIAGAPAMNRGTAQTLPMLEEAQMKELQTLLARRGYPMGDIDGRMGAATRTAVRQVQLKLGMPADSFPTVELLERLRGGGR
jgi:lytic murein transglycosylase